MLRKLVGKVHARALFLNSSVLWGLFVEINVK